MIILKVSNSTGQLVFWIISFSKIFFFVNIQDTRGQDCSYTKQIVLLMLESSSHLKTTFLASSIDYIIVSALELMYKGFLLCNSYIVL